MKFGEKFHAGSRFVDGVGIDAADSDVLRERIRMSEDGIVVVAVNLEEYTLDVKVVEIKSKGLVLSSNVAIEAKNNLLNSLKQIDLRKIRDEKELSDYIKKVLKNFLYKATKKSPMIIPIVMV